MTKTKLRTRSPGRPRSPDVEQAILDATLDLLAETGYSNLTVNDVAIKAGAGKSTIYRRWPAKMHLVVAAFKHLPSIEIVNEGSITKDLTAIVNNFIDILVETPLGRIFPSLIGEALNNSELMDLMRPIIAAKREPSRVAIFRAIDREELRHDCDVEQLIDAIMSQVIMSYFFNGRPPSRHKIRTIITNALCCCSIKSNTDTQT
ncbi:TetR/AcrR family transcriptional regulator [Denitratisoma oestradiolicum]|uniref:TetR family transcriptional regulator n=1 Tax=Denitratisoma oestradiolicum TaxID=311182 RepID=A0A6S6XU79_9PROT|nr:TetR/AcrR family transcriptional regulator [Denitratisoma oestradiolicum]TWO78838.1 hypothetical protein CBW56_17950 [Denitratisoma oestradiolicum]CAB1368345.1 TetR family transcriptional regulator [Denitratisoma oestradiolicum]